MKDLIKTTVLTLIVLLCLGISFLIASNVEQGIELLTRTELPLKDPDVELLYKTIQNNTNLRKADMRISELSNDEILKLVMNNISKNDYTSKTVKAEKIICEVTDKVTFNTESGSCNIRIIKTSLFNDYIKNNYNLEKELEFNDFDYNGYNCKLDGKKYYCLYTNTKQYVQGYSLFNSAYKTKDTIVISEYYLQVDLSDGYRCNLYFDEDYCADYKDKKREDIDTDIIKRDGVLYEHVFSLVDDKYYLENSYVKIEG